MPSLTYINDISLIFIAPGLHLNWYVYLGLAVKQNPAYLKLRKLRAAQSIARTVSILI